MSRWPPRCYDVAMSFYPIEFHSRDGWQVIGLVFRTRAAATRWVNGIEPTERRTRYRVGTAIVSRNKDGGYIE